jgi:hypothetical protein
MGNIVTWLESLLEFHHTAQHSYSLSSPSPTSSLTEALVSLTESLVSLVRVIKDLPSAMTIVEITVGIASYQIKGRQSVTRSCCLLTKASN